VAVVPILPKRGEIHPTLLDRAIRLQIRDQEVEKLLDIGRQLPQTTLHFPLDSDLICHGNDITFGRPAFKS
jgi:hypothetical protein